MAALDAERFLDHLPIFTLEGDEVTIERRPKKAMAGDSDAFQHRENEDTTRIDSVVVRPVDSSRDRIDCRDLACVTDVHDSVDHKRC